MEWRSVQVERPNSSTSGGQSRGGIAAGVGWAVGVDEVCDLIRAAQDAKGVQVRQLR